MVPVRSVRGSQPTSTGLGHHCVSPKKARNPRKTQTIVHVPGVSSKRERLLAQMAALMNPQGFQTDAPGSSSAAHSETPMSVNDAISYTYDEQDYDATNDDQHDQQVPCPPPVVREGTGRRLLTDKMAYNLYSAWQTLIPTLVDAHLKYSARTHRQPLTSPHPVISACASQACAQRCFSVICIFFDRFNSIDVLSCKCSTLAQVLVHHGLFPTAPSQPRMAVSVDLLAFYHALFERSCDAVHALASALKTHYARRGFQMINADGQVIQEPFRWGLGQAVQWFDILQTEVK
ncbi:uncharacterized protein HD556DRAFT_1442775 [Suillus plorans]|uniref:CxC1-like cysteine cluster associated with KDZ transposases domain-containing protein n=1 Tax=Suillus plorans TaxID=116603 RepID=A0A9P7AR13_9AGAM|nr:uncharacterized protein HD556DRAFT_1442775 [Suillus plorans]KAG1794592.1 hypothetical protein HD556DRAFT_1442775 [Suillus plorans]